MVGTIIGIILALIVLGVIWWGIQQLLPLIAPYVGEPFLTIIRVLIVIAMVLVVVWIIIQLLAMGGIHVRTFGF